MRVGVGLFVWWHDAALRPNIAVLSYMAAGGLPYSGIPLPGWASWGEVSKVSQFYRKANCLALRVSSHQLR